MSQGRHKSFIESLAGSSQKHRRGKVSYIILVSTVIIIRAYFEIVREREFFSHFLQFFFFNISIIYQHLLSKRVPPKRIQGDRKH